MLAKSLIEQGALWNCGVFGLQLGYVLDILEQKYKIKKFDYESMKKSFCTLNKTSFDYEVVEKAEQIRVLRYTGPWKDLGTWETFTEEIRNYATGNTIIENTCHNTHVINEQELPVVTMGLSNTVVVASRDGILVANKGQTHRLKDLTADISCRPMYEERRWGSYAVLDRNTEGEMKSLTKRISLSKNGQISYQFHNCRKEIWTILSGEGLLYLEGKKTKVGPGQVVEIDIGKRHGLKALQPLEMIEVQLGTNLVEDDIVRLEYDWI